MPRSFVARNASPIKGWNRDAVAATRDWIRERGDLLGPDRSEDDLHLSWDRSKNGIRHLRLAQTYKGVRVAGGEYAVAVDEGGAPRMITGRFHRDLDMDVLPTITADLAQRIAEKALPETRAADTAPELTIYPAGELGCDQTALTGGKDVLGWVVVRVEPPHDVRWQVLVDARSGELIAKGNELLHWPPQQGPEDCTSRGSVFEVDGTSPPSITWDALPGLQPDYQAFCPPHLTGTQVIVHNMAGSDATYTSFTGDFFFAANDLHFTEVNAYYHMETFIWGFLSPKGYVGLPTPGSAYVNGTSPPCGTCYQPSTHSWYFLRGAGAPGFENMALAADILTHESQHAVTSSFGISTNLFNGGAESNAFHEGVSDYFAAAYTGEPRMGEWAYPDQCPNGITRVDNDPNVYKYSNYGTVGGPCGYSPPNGAHANGMIISGALWSLRSLIGAFADQLVLEAMEYLPNQPTFGCIADVVWAMDQAHGGNNAVQIDAAFWQREIFGNQASTITGPGTLAPNVQGTFGLAPTCGRPVQNTITWSRKCFPCPGQPSCGDWVVLGTGPTVTTSSDHTFQIKATWTGLNGSAQQAIRGVNVVTGNPPNVEILGPTTAEAGTTVNYQSLTQGSPPFIREWRVRSHHPDLPGTGWTSWVTLGTAPTQDVFITGDQMELVINAMDTYCRTVQDMITITVNGGGIDPRPQGRAAAREPGITFSRSVYAHGIGVELSAPAPGHAKLSLYDLLGRRLATVWEGQIEGGKQSVSWTDKRLQPGLYFLRLELPAGVVNRRVTVLHW